MSSSEPSLEIEKSFKPKASSDFDFVTEPSRPSPAQAFLAFGLKTARYTLRYLHYLCCRYQYSLEPNPWLWLETKEAAEEMALQVLCSLQVYLLVLGVFVLSRYTASCLFTRLESLAWSSKVSASSVFAETVIYEAFDVMGELGWGLSVLFSWGTGKV